MTLIMNLPQADEPESNTWSGGHRLFRAGGNGGSMVAGISITPAAAF
jgi:hypothetical protein